MEEQKKDVRRKRVLVDKSPVFYGWIILLVGSLGLIMTSPGQTYSVSIFVEHFINDLGVSRSGVSTLYTLGTIIGSIALPIVGQQVDRHGSRLLVAIVAGLLGIACIYMGFVQNALMLGLGFILIRMFGQGSLTVVSRNAINQWWSRRRGMALGVSGMLLALLGTGLFPKLIFWLNTTYTWRITFVFLGLVLLLGMTPLALIFLRDRPEDYGLQPDGSQITNIGTALTPLAETNWTFSEATRSPTFWITALGLASMSMFSNGLLFHMISILDDNGLSVDVAVSVFLPIAIVGALITFFSSLLADWIPVRLLLTVGLFFQGLSLWMARSVTSTEMAIMYGAVLGMAAGFQRTVNSVVWATTFGRRNLGRISGAGMTIMIIGSALGPMPFGIGRDLAGNYNAVLLISAMLPLLLGVANLLISGPDNEA